MMRTIANVVPTTHVVKSIQHAWLGIGTSTPGHLVVLALLGVVTTVGVATTGQPVRISRFGRVGSWCTLSAEAVGWLPAFDPGSSRWPIAG